ncbi:MAG: NUDIX domain-containing protein [Gaiellaceae bacterium]
MSNSERRGRSAVVVRNEGRVALIKRVRAGHTYFLFPGGGIELGELPAEAAEREAREELGLSVVLGPRLLIEEYRGETQHYFSASAIGGEFGSGKVEELRTSGTTDDGTYEPVWVDVRDLLHYDVRPRALAAILAGG